MYWGSEVVPPAGQKRNPRLFLTVAPVYVWLLAITALPHKEERFLYVTYPLVGLRAAFAVLAKYLVAHGQVHCLLECSEKPI